MYPLELYHKAFRCLHYESLEDHIDENSEIEIKDSWYQDLYFEKENQELGFNWILGKTATFPFDQLTTFERTLISLYDHKGLTYEQVDAHIGYHRDTIWSKRKQIKRKLKELMKNPPVIKHGGIFYEFSSFMNLITPKNGRNRKKINSFFLLSE